MLNGTQQLITQFLPHNNNQSKPYRYSGYKIIQRSLRRRKQIRGFLSLKNIKYRIINRVLLLSGGLYEILLIIRCTTEMIPKAALEKVASYVSLIQKLTPQQENWQVLIIQVVNMLIQIDVCPFHVLQFVRANSKPGCQRGNNVSTVSLLGQRSTF